MPSSPWKQKYKKLSRFFNPNRKNFFNPKRKILKTVSGNCSGLFLSSSIGVTPYQYLVSSVSRSCLICVAILPHLCHDSASSVSRSCLICVTFPHLCNHLRFLHAGFISRQVAKVAKTFIPREASAYLASLRESFPCSLVTHTRHLSLVVAYCYRRVISVSVFNLKKI